MTKHIASDTLHLTGRLEQFYKLPEPSEQFKIQLETQLEQRRLQLLKNARTGAATGRIRKFLDFLFAPYKPAPIKFGIGILTALAGILVFSGLVYAIVTTFNIYIPGLGLANRESQFRSLPEPVTQTQDGVTVTIKQVLLTPEKTSLVMTIQGLSSGAMVTEDDSREAHESSCNASPEIALPDGTLLAPIDSGVLGYDEGNAYQRVFFYPPISESVREAQLDMPCIWQTRAGSAPENWVLPLTFVPAAPGEAAPIIEPAQPEDTATEAARLILLDQVIPTASGTIFTGHFSPVFAGSAVLGIKDQAPQITDASGKALTWRVPAEIQPYTDNQGVFHWAFEVEDEDANLPLTIQFEAVDLQCTGQAQFAFDSSALQEPGQILEVNKTISVGNCDMELVSIRKVQSGYTFRIAASDHPVRNVNLNIAGATHIRTSQVVRPLYNDFSLEYAGGLPAGELTVQFTDITIQVSGPWQVEWSPENEGVK